ncbi:hypothetical protein AG0111_0g8022 [Alternaria gaisen]|uniref:Uncharacterized protein n=1 Tax=Alternaria gaisen TaxID=167740 RepID=A0ACB6FGR4_9PLEO|nr:hypothetical protein AG0111_0g8022 [Alternaria gaisen]
MQFKTLAIIAFMALTGSAQKCEKGNNHNAGTTCHGATGNLACSNNLKHVLRCGEDGNWARTENCGAGLCLSGACHCG